MKISPTSINRTTFKRYYTTGRESERIKKILRPYEKELNKLTLGYEVIIKDDEPLYLYNPGFDEMVSLSGTKISIEPEPSSVNRLTTKVEICLNPAAEATCLESVEAEDIINTIKKGLKVFKLI